MQAQRTSVGAIASNGVKIGVPFTAIIHRSTAWTEPETVAQRAQSESERHNISIRQVYATENCRTDILTLHEIQVAVAVEAQVGGLKHGECKHCGTTVHIHFFDAFRGADKYR